MQEIISILLHVGRVKQRIFSPCSRGNLQMIMLCAGQIVRTKYLVNFLCFSQILARFDGSYKKIRISMHPFWTNFYQNHLESLVKIKKGIPIFLTKSDRVGPEKYFRMTIKSKDIGRFSFRTKLCPKSFITDVFWTSGTENCTFKRGFFWKSGLYQFLVLEISYFT